MVLPYLISRTSAIILHWFCRTWHRNLSPFLVPLLPFCFVHLLKLFSISCTFVPNSLQLFLSHHVFLSLFFSLFLLLYPLNLSISLSPCFVFNFNYSAKYHFLFYSCVVKIHHTWQEMTVDGSRHWWKHTWCGPFSCRENRRNKSFIGGPHYYVFPVLLCFPFQSSFPQHSFCVAPSLVLPPSVFFTLVYYVHASSPPALFRTPVLSPYLATTPFPPSAITPGSVTMNKHVAALYHVPSSRGCKQS